MYLFQKKWRVDILKRPEYAYLDMCRHVLEKGFEKGDRTGTGTISVFGYQIRFNLREGFPLLTTKRVPFRLVASELLWFIKGDTNIRFLLQHDNHIWDEWPFKRYVESKEYNGPDMTNFAHRAQKDEEFAKSYTKEMDKFCETNIRGTMNSLKSGVLLVSQLYGAQWRTFQGPYGSTDQLKDVIEQIKSNPDSRRHLVVSWNANQFSHREALLPPCHNVFNSMLLMEN